MSIQPLSRRRLMRLAGAALGSAGFTAQAEEEKPSDRGIGGTGIARDDAETLVGFVGTIRRFGSIFVNGARISYGKDVRVLIDGREADVSALRIGQVVNVVALERNGTYSTREIVVMHEVVGPIEALTDGGMTVLGQSVVLDQLPPPAWLKAGLRVAVSGLRRPDGVIVATNVEPGGDGQDQVIGVPRLVDGHMRIGDLALSKLDPRYLDRRTLVRGQIRNRRLAISQSAPLDRRPAGVGRMSIEAYIVRDGRNIKVGNDLVVQGGARQFRTKDGKAIFGLSVEKGGRLQVDTVRMLPQSSRHDSSRPEARPPRQGPAGGTNGGNGSPPGRPRSRSDGNDGGDGDGGRGGDAFGGGRRPD